MPYLRPREAKPKLMILAGPTRQGVYCHPSVPKRERNCAHRARRRALDSLRPLTVIGNSISDKCTQAPPPLVRSSRHSAQFVGGGGGLHGSSPNEREVALYGEKSDARFGTRKRSSARPNGLHEFAGSRPIRALTAFRSRCLQPR